MGRDGMKADQRILGGARSKDPALSRHLNNIDLRYLLISTSISVWNEWIHRLEKVIAMNGEYYFQ
jgi:hypothetical protein